MAEQKAKNQNTVAELKEKLQSLVAEKVKGTVKDVSQFKKTRKEIARELTKLRMQKNG